MISKTLMKKHLKYLLASIILFLVLAAALFLTEGLPGYARPGYLLHSAGLKELIHSFVFYVLLLLISAFIICFIVRKWYLNLADGFKQFFGGIYHDIKDRPKFWIINVIGWFVILFVSYIMEYIFGHVIVGEPNTLGTYFSPYRMGFFFFVLLLIFCFVRFRSLAEKPERAFVLICLASGILMSCTLQKTAVVSWDDETHYIHSVEQSGIGHFYESEADQHILSHEYAFSFNMKENAEMIETLNEEHISDSSALLDRKYGKTYQTLAYLPSALAIAIGRGLGLPFSIVFVMGRLANLIVYSLLVYFAIKKLKSGKMILMVIALFPTCLFLASNYSYDPWVTGFTMLGLSYLFYHLQSPDETVSRKDALIMLLSFLIGFSAKAIYFPIVLLLLFLRKKKFSSTKSYRRFVIGIGVVVLIVAGSFLLPMLFAGPSTDTRGGSDVNAGAQMAFILQNVGQYFGILMNFLKDYLSIENTGLYTANFAYFGVAPYAAFILVLLFVVTFTDKKEVDIYTSNAKFRIGVGIIAYITICLVATSLYIAYTPVAADTVAGCQPRYLIPVLFPIFYVLGGNFKTNYFTKKRHFYCVYAVLIFIIMSIIWQLFVSQYH